MSPQQRRKSVAPNHCRPGRWAEASWNFCVRVFTDFPPRREREELHAFLASDYRIAADIGYRHHRE
jgi:hypothetical protein